MFSALRGCRRDLPTLASTHVQKRYKYKPKWAVMSKKKAPSELALAHFNAYYEPLFGEKLWDSIRDALLRKTKKHCALVNNFAEAEDTIVDLISEAGAADMWTINGKSIGVQAMGCNTHRRQRTDSVNDMHSGSAAEPVASVRTVAHVSSGDNQTQAMAAAMASCRTSAGANATARVSHVGSSYASYDEEHEEFFTTPEGFLIPKPKVGPTVAVDLTEFIPAVKTPSDQELLLSEQQKQNSAPLISAKMRVLSSEDFRMPHLLRAYIHDAGVEANFRRPRKDKSGLLDYYLIDGASLLPVIALGLAPGDSILDLCAAPGGKTLAMIQTLLFDRITCVDASFSRLKRLEEMLHWYVPPSMQTAAKVSFLHMDGRRVGYCHPAAFDKVLVDVPCTTDRQALHEDENSLFSSSRKKERLQLPELQTQLLCSALEACRPGGTVVYSTCSLSPGQNDGVVEEACTRAQDAAMQRDLNHTQPYRYAVVNTSNMVERLNHIFKFWNGCTYGQVVLPSVQANFGPLYFCKIKKLPC